MSLMTGKPASLLKFPSSFQANQRRAQVTKKTRGQTASGTESTLKPPYATEIAWIFKPTSKLKTAAKAENYHFHLIIPQTVKRSAYLLDGL